MTYSYDPSGVGTTAKDTVRFLVQDNQGSDEHYLEDEEITYAVSVWYPLYGTYEYVAAMLADTIAARYAREVSYSADGVSIGLGSVGEQFRALAAALRQRHKDLLVGGSPDAGGIVPGEEPDIESQRPFRFGVGMHDDPGAGRQDYGNERFEYYGYYDGIYGG